MEIKLDDLSGEAVGALITSHLDSMHSFSPPESVHALALAELKQPDITFWSVWLDQQLAGCGAIKHLDRQCAELKSMRTLEPFRGRGVGRCLLAHILRHAEAKGYQRVLLETGQHSGFAAAHRLYTAFGFADCGPFAGYQEDPHSRFMEKWLSATCDVNIEKIAC